MTKLTAVVVLVLGVTLASCSKQLLTEQECTDLYGTLQAEIIVANTQGIDIPARTEDEKLKIDFCDKNYWE